MPFLNMRLLVDSAFVFATASRLSLDVEEYKQELLSAVNYDRVNHTINKLMERGLFATPTIIINDRLIYITNSYEELTRLLKQELNCKINLGYYGEVFQYYMDVVSAFLLSGCEEEFDVDIPDSMLDGCF